MDLREAVTEKYPDVRPLWLPSFADVGLVGVAEDYSGQVPLYDWVAVALHLLDQTSPREVFRKITPMMFQQGPDLPVVMLPPAKTIFWERVTSGRMMAWEMMHACIAGQGFRGYRNPPFIVYEWDAVIAKLTETVKDSQSKGTTDQVILSIDYYEKNMKPANAGGGTPVYWKKL